jgi:hypothetical protein
VTRNDNVVDEDLETELREAVRQMIQLAIGKWMEPGPITVTYASDFSASAGNGGRKLLVPWS